MRLFKITINYSFIFLVASPAQLHIGHRGTRNWADHQTQNNCQTCEDVLTLFNNEMESAVSKLQMILFTWELLMYVHYFSLFVGAIPGWVCRLETRVFNWLNALFSQRYETISFHNLLFCEVWWSFVIYCGGKDHFCGWFICCCNMSTPNFMYLPLWLYFR